MDAMSDSIGEPVAALDFLGSYRKPHKEEEEQKATEEECEGISLHRWLQSGS